MDAKYFKCRLDTRSQKRLGLTTATIFWGRFSQIIGLLVVSTGPTAFMIMVQLMVLDMHGRMNTKPWRNEVDDTYS